MEKLSVVILAIVVALVAIFINIAVWIFAAIGLVEATHISYALAIPIVIIVACLNVFLNGALKGIREY